jgi:hypothetical protein
MFDDGPEAVNQHTKTHIDASSRPDGTDTAAMSMPPSDSHESSVRRRRTIFAVRAGVNSRQVIG